MALPIPNLDDRRFQDLVDDAKRLVQQRCPEWTDHNVSDPGVTMIELYAWMTDQMLYRLNRIPERLYVKFLELIGVRLFPPTAAKAPVTFWLSAPQPETVHIPPGTQVATIRTETEEAAIFQTVEDLPIVASSLMRAASIISKEQVRDHSEALIKGEGFFCFNQVPKPGDALLVGLSEAVPSNAVTIRFRCTIEGVGVDPTNPPLAWEAWDGEDWSVCEVDKDTTGGLNRDGDVLVHVPRSHVVSIIDRQRAGWLRARVTEPFQDQPTYSASPKITAMSAFTIGGTAEAVNAEVIRGEAIGTSEGVPGQRYTLKRSPIVLGDGPLVLEVSEGEGWQEWVQVANFAGSGPADRHFAVDVSSGEIHLGPGVRLEDGALRRYGAVPAKGAQLRVAAYMSGGGKRGNVAERTIRVLKSSIPYVKSVENRRPAQGGVDGEDIENAKVRGPIILRTRSRAVTAEDYEQIAREAAPEVARVRCVPASDAPEAGSVRVLVVPAASGLNGRLDFGQLVPAEATLVRIASRLDETRMIGARVLVEPPAYRGLTVVAKIRSRSRVNPVRLQAEALEALFSYFHPIIGGPNRDGWPFGRPVATGEVFSVLQALRGTEMVEDVRLFGADPVTGQRGQSAQRLELEPNALVFSYEHQVLVNGD